MDTNTIEIINQAVQKAMAAQPAIAPVVASSTNTWDLVLKIVILAASGLAAYMTTVAAKKTAIGELKTTQLEAHTQELKLTTTEIHKAVNSGYAAMVAENQKLTTTVLDLSKSVATQEQQLRDMNEKFRLITLSPPPATAAPPAAPPATPLDTSKQSGYNVLTDAQLERLINSQNKPRTKI